jgi:predicted acylesterase/phospholipase RssA
LASAAIPVAFPPVHIQVEVGGEKYDEMHVDGGVSTQVFGYFFVPAAFSKTHIYVIRNAKLANEPKEVKQGVLAIATHSISMITTMQGVNDIIRIYNFSKLFGVDYNLVFIPQEFSFPHKGEFNKAYMNKLFEIGYNTIKSSRPWEKSPPVMNLDETATSRDGL